MEVIAGTVYIKELSAPKGYKLDTTVRSLRVEAGKNNHIKCFRCSESDRNIGRPVQD